MEIGFRTIGFRHWPIQQALEALAQLGFAAVELCLEHPDMRPEHLTETQALALAQEARALGFQTIIVSYHGDAEPVSERLDNQLRSIALTAALQAEVLILNTPRRLPGLQGAQWEELVSWLEGALLPAAESYHIRLALEPEPGLVLHGLSETLRLLSHLPHPLLGINLDIGHAWLTEGDVPHTIRQLAPWLWHSHWADFPAGEHRHLPPGEGDMPLTEIHQAFLEVGYCGGYTIDLFDIAQNPLDYARRSLQVLQEIVQGG